MQIARDMTSRPGVGTLMYMGEDPAPPALPSKRTMAIAGAAIWAAGGMIGVPKTLRTVAGIGAVWAYLTR